MKPLKVLPEEIGFYPAFKWCLVLEEYGEERENAELEQQAENKDE